jgi:uncharacterized GH25 family protein
MLPRGRRLLVAIALVVTAVPSAAHDFWIEPSTYRPQPLQRVTLRHRVGNHFLGDLVPRDETLLVRFVIVGADGEQRVPGVHGRDPAGIAQAPAGGGTLVVAYESRGSIAEMDAAKMAAFVVDEGVADQVPAGWRSKTLVRDRFTRSVKSLLQVGGEQVRGEPGRGGSVGFDRVVGLPLELVPLVDPATLGGGGALPVRLLFAGEPAAGIQVAALSRIDPAKPLIARTDADGRATFALPRGGEWLVKAVKVVPAGGPDADFGSVWATLTFAAGEP